MKATECLNAEHGVFLTQLAILKQMIEEKASIPEIKAATRIIAGAVEKHRDFEERYLYPAILRECGKEFPPIKVMEREHLEIVEYLHEIESSSEKNYTAAINFIRILEEHIQKEIRVLFPMALETLSAEELEEMTCKCTEHSGSKKMSSPSCCGGCEHKD